MQVEADETVKQTTLTTFYPPLNVTSPIPSKSPASAKFNTNNLPSPVNSNKINVAFQVINPDRIATVKAVRNAILEKVLKSFGVSSIKDEVMINSSSELIMISGK